LLQVTCTLARGTGASSFHHGPVERRGGIGGGRLIPPGVDEHELTTLSYREALATARDRGRGNT